uniref:Heteropteran venom family 1 protein 1 n=1 Tax=Ectomocoris sp. TaxID=3104572 RepID=A0AB38ZE54_9HEMI
MKYYIYTFATFCCFLAVSYGQSDMEGIRRNCHFQANLATIALDAQIKGAAGVEKGLAKSDEEIACIDNERRKAAEEGVTVVAETVGKIIPEVDALVFKNDQNEIDVFLKRTDYPAYKKSAMEAFKAKLKTWVPLVQSRMTKCRGE